MNSLYSRNQLSMPPSTNYWCHPSTNYWCHPSTNYWCHPSTNYWCHPFTNYRCHPPTSIHQTISGAYAHFANLKYFTHPTIVQYMHNKQFFWFSRKEIQLILVQIPTTFKNSFYLGPNIWQSWFLLLWPTSKIIVKFSLLTTSIKQQLALYDLNFYFPLQYISF